MLGKEIDSDIAYVDQTTLAELVMSLSNPSISFSFTIEGMPGREILDYRPHIATSLVRGSLSKDPITEQEKKAVTEIFNRDLTGLMGVWSSIQTLAAEDALLETNPEALIVGDLKPSSLVILIAFEINGPDFSGLMSLTYPWMTLETTLQKLDAWTPAN